MSANFFSVFALESNKIAINFADQFLKNTSHRLIPSESGDSAGAGDEADVEDNQPPSVTSSKSNVSENSGVSIKNVLCFDRILKFIFVYIFQQKYIY